MKHVDYLYFNIYHFFNRISPDKGSFNTRIQAMYLFSIGSGGWVLMLESLYLHLIRHAWFPSKEVSGVFAISIYILTAALFHYIFIVRDRDQAIFGKYAELAEEHPRQKQHLLFSLGVLVLPYLVLMGLAFFLPGHSR